MNRYPVSPSCPACGATKFKRVHDDKTPTLRAIRECKECGTRYEPPLPRWAAIAALGIGAAILLGGAVSAWFIPQVRGVLVGIALCGVTVMLLSIQQLRRSTPFLGPAPDRNEQTPAEPNERPYP
jgi:hypothetical protein